MRRRALLTVMLAGLAACGSTPVRVDRLVLPATWQGTLPCADCSGIRWTLTLRPEGEYWLERTYLGTKQGDRSFNERAKWRRGDMPDLIEMFGARLGLEQLQLMPDGALQKLGRHGKAPEGAPALLERQPVAVTSFGPVPVNALYRYGADAALLEDCLHHRKYNVVGGAAALELERAFLALDTKGAPRRALLQVTIAPKPAGEEGWPERVTLDKLERLTDAAVCGADAVTTPESNAWTPIEVAGEALAIKEGAAGAAARWLFEGGRFSGALVCNRASGGYNLEPGAFSFKVLATTRMACEPAVMAREQAMVEALNAVRRWTITDGRLELRDVEGAVQVRLRPLP